MLSLVTQHNGKRRPIIGTVHMGRGTAREDLGIKHGSHGQSLGQTSHRRVIPVAPRMSRLSQGHRAHGTNQKKLKRAAGALSMSTQFVWEMYHDCKFEELLAA